MSLLIPRKKKKKKTLAKKGEEEVSISGNGQKKC